MGTIFTILAIAIFFFLYPSSFHAFHAPIPLIFPIFAIILVVTQLVIFSLSLFPLQRNEQNLTPRLLELYSKDQSLAWAHRIIIFLTLALLFLTFLPLPFPLPLLAAGFIILGMLFDLTYFSTKKILTYLNPYPVSKMFTKEADKSILHNREIDLCESLESLSEIAIKALNRYSISLCNYSLDEMREIMRLFLDATKSIALSGPDEQAKSRGINDKVSYTLFFFFDRLEMIFEKALSNNINQVGSMIITLLGKISLYAAQCDLSLVGYVVHYIGKFSIYAEKNKSPDIALKGTCTLTEVSKSIIEEVPLTYMDLKDPFFSIITQLNEIGKATFRQDKQASIALLTVPFGDLKGLFQRPQVTEHPDTPAILGELDRVLAEWSTLETVLRTIPPIITEDKIDSSSESQP